MIETLLGMKINLDESELMPIGRMEHIEELVLELRCKESKLPFIDIGSPLAPHFRLVVVWDGVKERFYKRLSM